MSPAYQPPAPVPVFAKHGLAGRGMSEPTTFMFSDEAMTRPLGWTNGFLPDGAIYEVSLCERRVLRVQAVAVERMAVAS